MRRVLAITFLLTTLSAQAGEIYCNAQGRECSDRPTASANIARSTGTVTHAPGANSSAAASSGNANEAVVPDGGMKADQVAEQQRQNAAIAAANKTLQKDLADKRSEQCRKAQEYYKQSLEAAAIYRTDKDGKKQFLTDAEANQSRLNAKLEIDRTCGKAGG